MTGIKSGLATRLRDSIGDHFVNIHCFNHRLELAFLDVVKKVKLYDKLITLLVGLFYFYHRQYKNKKGLMDTCKLLNKKSCIPPKVTGTRWLPHLMNGIRSLLKGFKAYETHLSTMSHSNPKAEGLAKILLDKGLIVFCLVLQVIVELGKPFMIYLIS